VTKASSITRRDVLKAAAAPVVLSLSRNAFLNSAEPPPNIVFIVADDLGYADLSCYGRRDFRVAYLVRAVTPGVYSLPAAEVEDMYQPQYRARTAMGRVTVTAAQ